MTKISIKPLADRVIIEPAVAEKKQQAVLLFRIPRKRNRNVELL